MKIKENIQKEFEALLGFGSLEEELDHNAQMISFRILSEVEKELEKRKITKRKFAEIIGVSPDFLIQLFKGDKPIDFKTCAKIETVFKMKFDISLAESKSNPKISNSKKTKA